jgi:hypothetical protein
LLALYVVVGVDVGGAGREIILFFGAFLAGDFAEVLGGGAGRDECCGAGD